MIFLWVHLLALLCEAGRSVAVLLGAHSHVVKLGLLCCPDTAIALERSHGSLSTTVQGSCSSNLTCGCAVMSNDNSGFLSRGQLLDEAAGSRAR